MGSNAGSMLVARTADGSRPGYYGPDEAEASTSDFGKDTYKTSSIDKGGQEGISDDDARRILDARPDLQEGINNAAIEKAKAKERARKEKERIDNILEMHKGKEPVAYSYGDPIKNYKKEYFIGPNKFNTATKLRQLALKNLIDQKMGIKPLPIGFNFLSRFKPGMQDQDYTYSSGITTDMMNVNPQDYSDLNKYGLTGKNLTDIDRINKALDQGRSTGEITQTEFEKAFYGPKGPPVFGGEGGGGEQNILPYPYGEVLPEEEIEEEKEFDYRFGTGQKVGADVTRGSYIFNQGGRVPRAFGGIMDTATGRRAYGLGSIFKSITKPFKGIAKAAGKVLKSDLGKAALLAGGAYYLGGGTFGGLRSSAPGFSFSNLGSGISGLGKKLLLKDPTGSWTGKNLSLMKMMGLSAALPFIPGLNKAPENEDIGMTARGGQLIDPLTGKPAKPAEMRASLNYALDNAGGDPDKIKEITDAYAFLGPDQRLGTYLPYETYGVKDGGRIRAQEGGLMNLGGMEKDYRNEGGFVPIGKEEKADDVPARLSVNEFVFTADAVRNAGGGDIDKGAEVMENMMKNLENGGKVSEESQGKGNTGAQEMFSVSERIGEVI